MGGGGGAEWAEWDGGGGPLHVPRHVCSLSNPVALFSQHGDVCTHEHTELPIHKQTHKGNKGEGVQFQAWNSGFQAWKRQKLS